MTPFEEIRAARCRLRTLRESDLPAFARYRSDPETAKYQGWNVPYSHEQAEALYRSIIATPFGTEGSWHQIAVADLATDELLGDLAVHFIDSRQIEIGFTISPGFRGKGYAKEAAAALLDRLFRTRGTHRVVATVDARNSSAAGLLTALGFRMEAHFRKNVFFKGEWGDEFLFACLAEEWREKSNHG